MNIKIRRYYLTSKKDIEKLSFEYDRSGDRPAWIYIKDKKFDVRFISVSTDKTSEVIYKRFTGNFYYPVDLHIRKDDEKRFYDKYASYYDENTAKNNLPMARFILEKMKKSGVDKDSKVLDVGAGTGIFSELAYTYGYTNLTLLDIYQSMLDVAKKKPLLRGAKYITGNIANVELLDNYEVVVSIMMFDALDENGLEKALKNITNHLTDNGYIFLIEDKERIAYSKYFDRLEADIFQPTGKTDLSKYYFVGKRK